MIWLVKIAICSAGAMANWWPTRGSSKAKREFAPVVIGRVIVSPAARGAKLGYQLMEQALASCQAALAAKGDLPRGAGAPAIPLRPLRFYAGDRGL